ncbi:MAG TPA: DNRLRE domain-containing protein [Pirellulales bacterium]|nr:DNRLRE domain-containing protein [Pirellulales bacterium]
MKELLCLTVVAFWLMGLTAFPGRAEDLLLFDFEEPVDLKGWTNLELADAKVKEPAALIERPADGASSGKHALKITFGGGTWPTLTTTSVPADWTAWHTFKADVTVGRPCVVGFTVLQERSQRGNGYEEAVSRWTRTAFLKAGKNEVSAALRPDYGNVLDPKRGNVVRFEIFMYSPHAGEAITVDNIRLSTTKEEQPAAKISFAVAGTDLILDGLNASGVLSAGAVIELGKKLAVGWTKIDDRTVAQLEEEFAAQYGELKRKHPRAVLAVLRAGETSYDPAQPDHVYAGWKEAYFSSHGPDGMYRTRAENQGRSETQEIFMRHRSPLMRVDLASIPTGSQILAARLIVVRATDTVVDDRDPRKNPTMWVVEPCNRPWEEQEVNAFEYAKDKFWREVGGFDWGDDPDFLPVFLAHGPGRGKVNWWDFTLAVRFWTSGDHPNHGFMLHGDARDYMIGHTSKAKEIKNRPAVLVIYEPK